MSRLRWLGFAWLGLFLFWLPFEDVNSRFSLALGLLGSLWLGMRTLFHRGQGSRSLRLLLLGAAVGLGIPLLSSVLMIFKSGLHAHGFSDFSLRQVLAILNAAPLWTLLGAACGMIIWMYEQVGKETRSE